MPNKTKQTKKQTKTTNNSVPSNILFLFIKSHRALYGCHAFTQISFSPFKIWLVFSNLVSAVNQASLEGKGCQDLDALKVPKLPSCSEGQGIGCSTLPVPPCMTEHTLP